MRPRLLVFDLYTGGHHRTYLETLARHWLKRGEQGLLEIAAPAELLEEHPDFARWLDVQDQNRVAFHPVPMPTALREGDLSLAQVLRQDLLQGRVLSEVLNRRKPGHVLAMYFDHLQASLALRRIRESGGRRTPVSGIYFRPSFHYEGEALTTRLRKRALLRAALSNKRVHRVLSLDPFAVEELGHRKLRWLPDGLDPAKVGEPAHEVRRRWGVEKGRRMLLFFGVISARKGIHELLRALPHLETPATLVIAGRIPAGEREAVESSLRRAAEDPATDAVIVHQDRYLRDDEVQDLIAAADAAVVPYRHHVGSSHVLIRAAAAGTPVVGPEFGLVGRLIKQHALGRVVNPERAEDLARAIADTLEDPAPQFDLTQALRFAETHHVDAFVSTIFEAVLS